MVSIDIGRICVKLNGKEAGRYCVVVKKIDKSFVEVTGPRLLTGVKRRKSNVAHLEPTQYVVDVQENQDDEQIISAMEKQNLTTKLNLKKPSAAELKSEKTRSETKKAEKEKKAEVKKEAKKTKEKK